MAGGFTLVEMLLVVSIIGLLTTLIVPSLGLARQLAKQAVCTNNMRCIAQATVMYSCENNYYPPAYVSSEQRWMDLLAKYADKKSGMYRCPCDDKQIAVTWDPDIVLSYGMNTFRFSSNEYCFWYGVKTSKVASPAKTILYADCTPGLYYCGGGTKFAIPVPKVDYRHHGGFVVAYCDGHCEYRTTTEKDEWDASK